MDEVSKPRIKSFVFLDLESTGIPGHEYGRSKITEITMISILRDYLHEAIQCPCKPRVMDKLTLCVYPRKFISEYSTHITGLSNSLLEQQHPFDSDAATMIRSFLNHSPAPVCMIAHNGIKFDFPLLKAELNQLGITLPIICADSLLGFRKLLPCFLNDNGYWLEDEILTEQANIAEQMIKHDETSSEDWVSEDSCKKLVGLLNEYEQSDNEPISKKLKIDTLEMQKMNETTPKSKIVKSTTFRQRCKKVNRSLNFSNETSNYRISYKLDDIYKRLFNENARDSHKSEEDVITLIKCVCKVGDPLIRWFDENSVNFSDIKKLW